MIKKILRKLLGRMPVQSAASRVTLPFVPGHFYSPIVDPDELKTLKQTLWPLVSPPVLGIDFNHAYHEEVLAEDFPKFMPDYCYPEHEPADKTAFYTQNSQFTWLDSRSLFVLLRKWQPAQIIEVGSGFSSLLMADVNHRFMGGKCNITCVEPYPRPFCASLFPAFPG